MVHWARKVLNDSATSMIASLPHREMDALEIAGRYWSRLEWKSFTDLQFPQFDIVRDIIYDKVYDIIFAEQVLEHVPYPYRAVRNVYRMLKPKGFFLVTLPFLVRVHNIPIDCSRWTPLGLSYFLEECGFDRNNVQVNSWGNRECVTANFDSWVDFDAAKHSLDNDPNLPIVVWALAQK